MNATAVNVESRADGALVLIPAGFAGNVVLHCSDGRVVKYEVKETRRPTEGAEVDLSEHLDKERADAY